MMNNPILWHAVFLDSDLKFEVFFFFVCVCVCSCFAVSEWLLLVHQAKAFHTGIIVFFAFSTWTVMG
jgi:hypothetical protein